MIDGPFRNLLPRYTPPLIRAYTYLGLTPNMISLNSVLMAGVSSVLCVLDAPLLAIGTWWLGRALDGTDGIYARATGKTSDFGAYLDIVCDMMSYSMMVLALAVRHPQLALSWSCILFFYVLCITSALALGSLEVKKNVGPTDNRGLRLAAGLAEGGETGLAYTLFLLFPGSISIMSSIWLGILATTVLTRSLLARKILA